MVERSRAFCACHPLIAASGSNGSSVSRFQRGTLGEMARWPDYLNRAQDAVIAPAR
ncbi:MAG TPA: hypothetical protein VMU57_09995 [Edaphobacter sp.]|nr:hypothetical protein [Edaphobacter sp.]